MLRDTPENSAVTSCGLEPIHIPGSIQPHGIMLVADEVDQRIVAAAGHLTESYRIRDRSETSGGPGDRPSKSNGGNLD